MPATNCTAGNLLVLLAAGRVTGTVSSVTDTKGNTWTVDKTASSGTSVCLGVCSTLQDAGALTTTDTITVTFSGSSTCAAWLLEEFFGFSTGAAADQTATDGASTNVTSGDTGTTSATSQAVELAIAGICLSGAAGTVTKGSYLSFTTAQKNSDNSGTGRAVAGGYKILAATGTQIETFTWPTGAAYTGIVATYTTSAGGGGGGGGSSTLALASHGGMFLGMKGIR